MAGYLIPEVRAALRRGDCAGARILIGDAQHGRLTSRQQTTVRRLLQTVERCDIKHAGVGRARRRLGAPPKFIGTDRGAATALSQSRWTPLRKDETHTIREYESPAGPWRLTATTDGEWFVRGPDPDAPGSHMDYASGTSTDIDSGRDADILKEAKKRAEIAYKAARAKAGLGRVRRVRRRR